MEYLAILLAILGQLLKWFGFKEEQMKKYQEWIKAIQAKRSDSTLPADQEIAAEAELIDRIDRERQAREAADKSGYLP